MFGARESRGLPCFLWANRTAGSMRRTNKRFIGPLRNSRTRDRRSAMSGAQGIKPASISVHRRSAGPLTWAIGVEHEGHEDQEERQPGEFHVDVLIALHLRLLVELVVNRSERHTTAVGATKCAAEESG